LNQKNTKMANPTLITGFEDVLTYIRQQDKRIKRLEEENEKLQKENKEYEFESCESVVASQKIYGQAFAIQAERDKLQKENEQLKEDIQQYKDTLEEHFVHYDNLKEENKKLKGRVDIMEKCKKAWYDKCQEDPDDDPERSGIKWSICLEGGLNHFMKEAIRYEESYDEENKTVRDFADIIAELATMIENIDQNACDVFNKLTEKYRDEVEELKCSK